MNWIYQKWWKWLCAVLLIYVLVGSFFVPLGPGITKVSPSLIYSDSLYTFRVTGHNTHFTSLFANANSPDTNRVQLWFKFKSEYFLPDSLVVIDRNTLEAKFGYSSLNMETPTANFDVVVNDDIDGTFALREIVTLVRSNKTDSLIQDLKADTSGVLGAIVAVALVMSNHSVEPEVKNNKHQLNCFPYREILYETIRNTFFHVPMWFVMTVLVFVSFIWSILFLIKGDSKWDLFAHQSVIVALVFSACGYFTGLVWAKYTWYIGVDWLDVVMKLLLEDIKMAAALVAIIFYIAYMVIRSAMNDKEKAKRVAAMFNVVAFVVFIFCVFVIPRLTDSMHPGNGGNPAFSKYDLDSTLRMFFYPAVIGWILLGFWFFAILIRIKLLQQKQQS